MSADDPDRPDGLSRRALLGRVGAAGAFVALTDVLPPAVGDAEAQAGRAAARDPLETYPVTVEGEIGRIEAATTMVVASPLPIEVPEKPRNR